MPDLLPQFLSLPPRPGETLSAGEFPEDEATQAAFNTPHAECPRPGIVGTYPQAKTRRRTIGDV
jgi:hypothetical protein